MALAIVAPMPRACKICCAPVEPIQGRGRPPSHCKDHKRKNSPAICGVFYCLDCGCESKQSTRGRRKTRCNECSKRKRRDKAGARYVTRLKAVKQCNIKCCLICLNVFYSQSANARLCGDCKKTHDGVHKKCECKHCGATFRPKRYDRTTFCSRECSYGHKSSNRLPLDILSAKLKERQDAKRKRHPPRRCACCAAVFVPKAIHQLVCSKDCQVFWARKKSLEVNIAKDTRDRSPRPCAECSKMFAPEYGNKKRNFCSDVCCRKNVQRTARTARKLRVRVTAVEMVNPINVFDRDGWRCQLCKCLTPRKYRGSYHPRAPELDHIVPLSAGGEHSYRNTQCACRSCNSTKGARALGQMRLFG